MTDEEELAIKIVVIGGTGLICLKERRHSASGRPRDDRCLPTVGVNTITADGPKEAPVEPAVVIDLSHWPSLAQGGVGILRDIFIAA